MADTQHLASAESADQPRYARLSRRLRAVIIDWVLLWVAVVACLILASTAANDSVGRALGFVLIIAALLYEPVLVCATGSTLGHHLTNLRVVDDRTRGNLGFTTAAIRFVLKFVLGLFSFLAIAATRRNQAFHDVLTHSTVQIRDPLLADPSHYVGERTDFAATGMPSHLRRLLVIAGYLAGTWILGTLVLFALATMGLMSSACVASDQCTFSERLLTAAVGLAWLALAGTCIGLGWRGRLYGARRQHA